MNLNLVYVVLVFMKEVLHNKRLISQSRNSLSRINSAVLYVCGCVWMCVSLMRCKVKKVKGPIQPTLRLLGAEQCRQKIERNEKRINRLNKLVKEH